MACQTVATHRRCIFAFGCFLGVTFFAADLAVRTIKHVFGALVMVEVPQSPRPGVMATLTTQAQFLLVLVFFFVAGVTLPRRILETRGLVAGFTSCNNVSTGQWKARQRMIEFAHFPVTVVVARFTRGTSLPFVLVIFFMTTQAVRGRFPIALQVFVARRALEPGLSVRIAQTESGFVM